MAKILGLDLGTNSIGWAVTETDDYQNFSLLDKGVRIFQEGVKIEKGVESSKAAERTGFRSARRIKYRRKLRKINTLAVLAKYGYCPGIDTAALRNWRYKKIYPSSELFRNWQKTDEATQKNPYHFRAIAAQTQLDLTDEHNRQKLGRAFYHLAQRRGFLSNRLETTKENNGAVIQAIDELSEAKAQLTLGQYFYQLYTQKGKIRKHYTHREKHYLEEFETICRVQQLPGDFTSELRKAIFFQRPLRSQKALVGHCPFEKNKARCPISHPAFEQFRMLAFINSIKIQTPGDELLRALSQEEKTQIAPLFYRKSKEHFNFEEIAKKLCPKNTLYLYFKEKEKPEVCYQFNYSMNSSVSGCRTIAQLREIFGEDWEKSINERYTLTKQKNGKKSSDEVINDIWHVLFSFDKTEKLKEFASLRLGLEQSMAEKFAEIKLKRDYASLSLKAIRKINPYLQEGLLYNHAVFLAKLEDLIPRSVWSDDENKALIKDEIRLIIESQNYEKQMTDLVNGIVKINRDDQASWSENPYWQEALQNDLNKKLASYYGQRRWDEMNTDDKDSLRNELFIRVKKQMQANLGRGSFAKTQTIEERIKNFISDQFEIDESQLEGMYHPSAIEVYREARRSNDGNYYLDSPMISAVRNPMAMRSLHQLRRVINELLKEGTIDRDTKINIEMARDLKNANERKALQRWQKARENERNAYREQLKKDILAATGKEIEPSDRDLLKYQLWEEQNHMCLYTGAYIGLAEFIGDSPKYDIEHTIPRSLSFDNSQENLTLCDSRYNREVKRNRIPSELPEHSQILERLKDWENRIEETQRNIDKAKFRSKVSIEKNRKDKAIEDRHFFQFEHNYWQGKYKRFVMKDVPEGFKNSQLVDTGIITKYARLYLKTVFRQVNTVKGKTVADFRKLWGIQDEFESKERSNHIHHCMDAVTMACISQDAYQRLAKAYHDWEENRPIQRSDMPQVEKPWPTFTEEIKKLEEEVLVSHYTPDNLPKKTKKILRIRGKKQYNEQGEPIYQQGHSVRASLHKDTCYGAIKQTAPNKKGITEEQTVYVVRKAVDSLTDSDIQNIVDCRIRTLVEEGKKREAVLRKELEKAEKRLRDAELPEIQEQWQHEVQSLHEEIRRLYAIPNHDGSFTPIKKVRCIARTVTDPVFPNKKHRDERKKKSLQQSQKEYKRFRYYANDGNYLIALYQGIDNKGKIRRDFIVINNMTAAKYFNNNDNENTIPEIHPKSGLPLQYTLKTGTMILVWKDSPEEVWKSNKNPLTIRLYKLVKFDKSGRLYFRPHTEARPANELKEEYTFSLDRFVEQLCFSSSKFTALVEGYDFTISPTGKITRLK